MGKVRLLARLLKLLDELAPGLLLRAGWLKYAVEIGGGLVLGAVIVLLLIVFVLKFGARMFGQFVEHDTFPAVVTTVTFLAPIVPPLAAGSWVASLAGLSAGIAGAFGIHGKAVEIRDNARKKDLPADTTPTEVSPAN